MAKKKEKGGRKEWLPFVMGIGVGAAMGVFLVEKVLTMAETQGGVTVTLLLLLVLGYFALVLQVVVHEGGHLVCGLLSGYQFVSFRVGKIVLIQDGEKFSLKKFHVMGTGGQCLLMPPEGSSEEMPYRLYNFGGIMANALLSLLCFAVCKWVAMPPIIELSVLICAWVGIYILVTNGIPMKVGGISNDGYNMRSLGKDPLSRKAFYLQIKVNGLQTRGTRIKDMPLEWFLLPEDADYDNPLICSMKILEGNYYYDRREFDKAKECYLFLLNASEKLLPVYRFELLCELLFCEIIGACRPEEIERYDDKSLKKYIKATACYISRMRLLYAYDLLVERDEKKAEKTLKKVYQVAKTYPVKAEVESELEIVAHIQGMRANALSEKSYQIEKLTEE